MGMKRMNFGLDKPLINEIRKRPFLYDILHADYKDLQKKELAWKEISRILNVEETQCKMRWRGLRSSYTRLKRTNKIPKETLSGFPRCRWRYLKCMSFLDNVHSSRLHSSLTMKRETPEPEEGIIQDIMFEICEDFNSIASEHASASNSPIRDLEVTKNMDMDGALIEEVRLRPLIYDVEHEDYKCLRKKQMAWDQIAATLNLDACLCRRRWKGLRDTYKRCKRLEKVNKKISSKKFPKRQWRYCKTMAFLDKIQTGRCLGENSISEFEDSVSAEEHDPIDMSSEKSMTALSPEPEDILIHKQEEQEQDIEELHHNEEEQEDKFITEEETDRDRKFDKFLQLAASSISQTCEALVGQRKPQDSTALHFASLAAKIREAHLPLTISNQIEAKVAALVFSELEHYQDYLCTRD